jgi:prepilin-type N-terminal cleavage/methylation domain-containing protein
MFSGNTNLFANLFAKPGRGHIPAFNAADSCIPEDDMTGGASQGVCRSPHGPAGFTLVEFLVVTALVVAISTIVMPLFSSYYEGCCLKAAVAEITGMIREAKQRALIDEKYYAVGFDPVTCSVSLLAAKGRDGKWNSADDQVMRSFRLTDKGGGLKFGYGGYGPLPGLAKDPDGVTFQSNNTLVCNADLTGSAGTVYIISRRGAAMALTMNSSDFSYTLYRWSGKKWVRI